MWCRVERADVGGRMRVELGSGDLTNVWSVRRSGSCQAQSCVQCIGREGSPRGLMEDSGPLTQRYSPLGGGAWGGVINRFQSTANVELGRRMALRQGACRS